MTLHPTPIDSSPSSSSADPVLCRIPQERWRDLAPIVAPYLALPIAYTRGQQTLGSVFQALDRGQYQLWTIIGPGGLVYAAMVTEILQYVGGAKTCMLLLLGGTEMRRWIHLIEEVEQWAREEGCSQLEIHGRRGWKRMLKQYTQPFIVLRKEL